MINKVYKDTDGNRRTIADLGATWVSERTLAELGWTEVGEDYQKPIADAEALTAARLVKEGEIKSLLSATDYKAIKYAEGLLTPEEYMPTKTYREALRTAYNTIESATTVIEVKEVVIPSV